LRVSLLCVGLHGQPTSNILRCGPSRAKGHRLINKKAHRCFKTARHWRSLAAFRKSINLPNGARASKDFQHLPKRALGHMGFYIIRNHP
jgi:hypothetical protein